MIHTIRVEGGDFRPYDVLVGSGLLASLGERAKAFSPTRVAVITDSNVAALHARTALASLSDAGIEAVVVEVPAGEASKSFAQLDYVLDQMIAQGLDRRSMVVALGGGVIGDLAGLAAALFMRGIDFIQVPTTLLAQVDSSVGGKTAIDTPRGKNLVGAFHQPRLVLADIELLQTLPMRQIRSGWAEILKHGLICDPAYFEWLSGEGTKGAAGDAGALTQAVVRSVEIKALIVGEDEKEAGRRALLNLGHTFGHALEVEVGFDDTLTHGEAVAAGCAMAMRYSALTGLCSNDEAAKAEAGMRAAGLPTRLSDIPHAFDASVLLERMLGDKKAEGGKLTLVLAHGIGQAFVDKNADRKRVLEFLKAEGAG
ncbi:MULTISPECIES: 3-dehydroquinate synthase [unclassified Brevundimonas]|uniref:3-dehydroquinate synthase n=1 Tax=unclassified Brevundimonas TaxID=2622653 RepID=UPI0025BEEB01|nr:MULTISPECIES: 3-dehydroquinate synthase [unclassified Brevundimonas]